LAKVCLLALANTDAVAHVTTNILTLVLKLATLTVSDKCTYVAYGVTNPPAFKLGEVEVATKTAGLNAASSWVIHHMEYNSNQLPVQGALNYITTT